MANTLFKVQRFNGKGINDYTSFDIGTGWSESMLFVRWLMTGHPVALKCVTHHDKQTRPLAGGAAFECLQDSLMEFEPGWLVQSDDQNAMMCFIAMFDKTFVGGD